MKRAKSIVKTVFFISLAVCIILFGAMTVLSSSISKNYKVNKGETFSIKSNIPISADIIKSDSVDTAITTDSENYEVSLKIFGLIPFSTVNVQVVDRTYVSVLGVPFGMRIYTEGVLIIETSDIKTKSGKINPAQKAGLNVGDYILSVNGKAIGCNEDLADLVTGSNGEKMTFRIKRGDKTMTKTVQPVFSEREGEYRVGIWVRDSSAGIGTLTFYSPTAKTICGLGHGLTDSDTGKLLSVNHGQMVSARIVSVQKGKAGTPGELGGQFTNTVLADISVNSSNGVYGAALTDIPAVNLTQVAMKQEITDGSAQILCTVEGDTPKLYSCEIKRHSEGILGGNQDISVKVTDPDLIKITGGIVQGMSGSPVLQNGKLVGAITHVLVDDPTIGYAVFAEDMLNVAETAGEKLKEAG